MAKGDWLRIDNGVYAHPAARPTFERSVMAAVLAEPWAVASHRSAAVLHGLVGFRPGRPEITIRPGANGRGQIARKHRGVDVATAVLTGIPAVTIAQVFVDLVQVVPARRVQTALAARADTQPSVLSAVGDRFAVMYPRGGRNLRPLRGILTALGAGPLPSETELERRLRQLVERPEVPAVRWQAPFPGRAPGPQRVDGLIDEWRLVIEADGRAWHTRIEDFERDRRRDAEAAAAGYQTLRYTWHQITAEPSWCLSTLVTAGRRRAA